MESLPDSRLSRIAPRVVPHKEWGMAQEVFCANCCKSNGYVPADALNCYFAFVLCNECWEKCGPVAGTMAIPESEVRRVARLRQQEQSTKIGVQ